jgi:hypothetical protein
VLMATSIYIPDVLVFKSNIGTLLVNIYTGSPCSYIDCNTLLTSIFPAKKYKTQENPYMKRTKWNYWTKPLVSISTFDIIHARRLQKVFNFLNKPNNQLICSYYTSGYICPLWHPTGIGKTTLQVTEDYEPYQSVTI